MSMQNVAAASAPCTYGAIALSRSHFHYEESFFFLEHAKDATGSVFYAKKKRQRPAICIRVCAVFPHETSFSKYLCITPTKSPLTMQTHTHTQTPKAKKRF